MGSSKASLLLVITNPVVERQYFCCVRMCVKLVIKYALLYGVISLKLQLHDAIYRLRFYSNSLTHILSLSNSHNNVASLQKNRGDESHRVIVALC